MKFTHVLAVCLFMALPACSGAEKVLGPSEIGFHHRLHRLLPNSTLSVETKNARGPYTLSFYLAPDFTGLRHVSPLPGFQGGPETRQITRWWIDQNNRFCAQYTPQARDLATAPSAWTCYGLRITQASELTFIDARQAELPVRQVAGNALEAEGRALQSLIMRTYGPQAPLPQPPPRLPPT